MKASCCNLKKTESQKEGGGRAVSEAVGTHRDKKSSRNNVEELWQEGVCVCVCVHVCVCMCVQSLCEQPHAEL